jgi:glycosyltransferase involved in cell wall biosynthesis
MDSPFKPCLILPVYNHELPLVGIVERLDAFGLACFLIDDGSAEPCARVIRELAERFPWIETIRLERNGGKGGAIKLALAAAERGGYTHALQIDADGQHDTADIPKFLEQARDHPQATIVGQPIFDASIPRHRFYFRYLTHVWVWINTLSFSIRDALCGYRVYPVAATARLIRESTLGNHMEFEVEILVKLYWRGVAVLPLPTRVIYPEDGISHFRLFEDNVLLSLMQARLFLGMLRRLPGWLVRHFH